MNTIDNIINFVRDNRVVYSGQILICARHDVVPCVYLVIGLENKNPTIIELELSNDIELFGDNFDEVDKNIYLISDYDIYDVISIIGETQPKENIIHVDYSCNNIDDSRTIGYILSELCEYAQIVVHSSIKVKQLKFLIEILETVKEEAKINHYINNILFMVIPINCSNYNEIITFYRDLLNNDLTIFDKNTSFELGFGSDQNPMLSIIINSSTQNSGVGKEDFKKSRGLILEQQW